MTLLKEFDLDLPGDKERRRLFRLQTRCVTALYERLFPKFKTNNCWKILVECVGIVTTEQYRNLLGAYALEVQADVESFFSLPDVDKKAWTLNTLQAGICKLLKQTGWPAEPFLETYRKVQDLRFVNRWTWKKPITSPSRRLVAEVLVDHNVQSCDISVVVRDRNNQEVKRATMVSELPDEWAYTRHLGSLVWDSDTRVVLKNKEGSVTWQLDV